MKAFLKISLLVICSFNLVAQQELIPLGTYFRDNFHTPLYNDVPINAGHNGWYSVSRKYYDLDTLIQDFAPQYYDVTQKLYKEHLVQLHGKNFSLEIDPLFNFTVGKDFADTSSARLLQNTRGFQARGTLIEKVGFFTSFHENQSVFADYRSTHYDNFGEQFLQVDSTYNRENATIPAGGRTKPFKTNGYDYGFATSYITFMPTSKLLFTFGSMQDFVGSGYRSILLSDNSYNYTHLQYQWKINPKLTLRSSFGRHNNLLRLPNSTTVEATYEKKNLSVNYITFSPTEKLNISFFESTHWLRGDSTGTQRVNGLFYNPVPIVSTSINGLESKNTRTILGLNLSFTVDDKNIVYGQFALSKLAKNSLGYQFGIRSKELFDIKQSFLQFEINSIVDDLYLAENRRLNYTQFNLPVAHPRGGGFTEFVLRYYIENSRAYFSTKSILYLIEKRENGFLGSDIRENINVNNAFQKENGFIMHQEFEVGYRFNRKTDFKVFARFTGRAEEFESARLTNSIVELGMKTGLFNSYSDF